MGVGINAVFILMNTSEFYTYETNKSVDDSILAQQKLQSLKDDNNKKEPGFLYGLWAMSGGEILFKLMLGDLKANKIGLIMDIGAGWLFTAKIGIYLKGFTFKVGYHLGFPVYADVGANITFDIGYTINWAYKPIGK